MQYEVDMTRCLLGVGNVAVMTSVADVMEMADHDDVTGLVRAGDVDAIGTGDSEAQGDEMSSGPPGWAGFPVQLNAPYPQFLL